MSDTGEVVREVDWSRWARCESPGNKFWSPLQCYEHCPHAYCANSIMDEMIEKVKQP